MEEEEGEEGEEGGGACDPATAATSVESRFRLERSSPEVVGVAVGVACAGDRDCLLGSFGWCLGSECTPVELLELTDNSEGVVGLGVALPEVR